MNDIIVQKKSTSMPSNRESRKLHFKFPAMTCYIHNYKQQIYRITFLNTVRNSPNLETMNNKRSPYSRVVVSYMLISVAPILG